MEHQGRIPDTNADPPPNDDFGHWSGLTKQFFLASPDGMILCDSELAVVAANPAATSLLGLPDDLAASARKPTLTELVPSLGRTPHRERLRRIMETGKPANFHVMLTTPDNGRDRHLYIVGFKVNCGIGLVVREPSNVFAGRRPAETADDAAEWSALLENSASPMIVIGEQGDLVACNDAMLSFLESSRKDVLGANIQQFATPDSGRRVLGQLTSLLHSGGTLEIELQVNHRTKMLELTLTAGTWRDEPVLVGAGTDATNRHRAEESARAAESRYKALFDNPLLMVFLNDENGTILEANPAAMERMGYTESDLGHVNFVDLLHPDDRERVFARMASIIAGGSMEYRVELRLLTRTGELMWIEMYGFVIERGEGTYLGLGVASEITARKRAEAALAESEEQYRLISETSMDGIYQVDSSGHMVYCNTALTAMLDYERDEMIGRHFSMFVPESEVPRVQEQVSIVLRGESLNAEVTVRDKHGNLMPVFFSAVPNRSNGEITGLTGILKDVTSLKRTEAALAESERRFRLFMDHLPGVAFINDANGFTVYGNRRIHEAYGLEPGEYEGHRLEDVNPDYAHTIRQQDSRVLTEGITLQFEETIPDQSGPREWLTTKFPIPSEGEASLVGGVAIDITDLRRLEKKLFRQQRRFQSLIEHSSDVVCLVGANGELRYISPAVEGVLGYRLDDLAGKRPLDFVHPEDSARAADSLALVSNTHSTTLPVDIRVRHVDGSWRTLEVSGTNHIDDPAIGGIVVSFRDVTERRQAEEALRESEIKYATLVQQAKDAVIIEQDELLVFVSQGAESITGYAVSEIQGKHYLDLVVTEHEEIGKATYRFLLAGKIPAATYPSRILRKDGTTRDIELSVSTIEYRGRPALMAVVRDVTERNRMERSLRGLMEFEKLVSELSAAFVNVPSEEVDAHIEEGLRRIVEHLGLDRSTLLEFSDDKSELRVAYSYARPGAERSPAVSVSNYLRWYTDRLRQGDVVRWHRIEDLPEEAELERLYAEVSGIKSNLSVRVDIAGAPSFVIAMGSFTTSQPWPEEWVPRLRILGEVFANAIIRRRTDEALRRSEEKARGVLESATEMIYRLDLLTGNYDYVSPSVRYVLGMEPEDYLAMTIWETRLLTHPDDLPRLDANVLKELLADPRHSELPSDTEYRILNRQRGYRWVCDSRRIVWSSDGTRQLAVVGSLRDIHDRKEAEDRLRRSEELFRSLIENATDFIVIIDADGKVRYESPSVARLIGYEPDERVGKSAFEHVHPNDVQRVIDTFAALREQPGATMSMELRFGRKDGSFAYAEGTGRNLIDHPAVEAIVVNLRDITERKLAEAQLKQSEEKYRSFVQNFGGVAYRGYTDWGIDFFHGKVEELTGYTEDEFKSGAVRWDQIIHPEDLPHVASDVSQTIADKEPSHAREYRIIRKNGEIAWVREILHIIVDDSGNASGAQGVLLDITERRLAEAQLRESEEKLRLIFESVHEGIAVTDLDGVVTECNTRIAQFHGSSSKDAILGHSALELIAPRDRDRAKANMQSRLAGHPAERNEYAVLRADGTEFASELISTVLRNDLGDAIGLLATIRDISERKKAEDALRANEDRYRNLFNNAQVGLFRSRISDGKFIECNDLFAEMVGYPSREECLADFVASEHYADPAVRQRMLAEIADRGQVRSFEALVTRADGSPFWVSYSAHIYPEKGYIEGAGIDITERKLVEDALRRSEHKYRTLVESMHDGLWVIDQKARTTFVNPRMEELLGYDPGEMIGRHLFEFMDEHDKAIAKINLARRRQGIAEQHDFKFIRKDGTAIWATLATNPLFDESGSYIGAMACIADITERKRAEEAIRHSEARFRELADLLPQAVFETDNEGNLTFLNQKGMELSGYSVEDIDTGLNCLQLVVPEERELALLNLQLMIQGAESVGTEYTALRKDGSTFPVVLYSSTISREGQPVGLRAVAMDITERKMAEEALRRSEQRFKALTENALDVIVVVGADGKVAYESPSVERVMGYTPEDVVGRKGFEYLHPEDVPAAAEMFADLLTHPGETLITELRVHHRDGSLRFVEAVARNLLDDPAVSGIVVNFRDITERKQAEQLILSRMQMQQLIAETTSHFAGPTCADIDRTITDALGRIGTYIGVHRIYINIFAKDQTSIAITHEWCDSDIELFGFQAFSLAPFPWALSKLNKGESIRADTLDELPQEASNERSLWQSTGVKSIIGIPLIVQGSLIGFMGCSDERNGRTWQDDDMHILTIIGQTMANAIHRIQAEEAQRASEEKLRSFMDSATDSFFLWDSEFNMMDINESAAQRWGVPREELIGKNMLEFSPELKSTDRYKKYLEVLSTGSSFESELLINHPRLGSRWHSFRAFRVGTGLGIISTDVTRRKENEEELDRYRQHLEELVQERTIDLQESNEELLEQASERIKAQKEVQREKDKAQKYLDIAAVVLLVIDTDGTVSLINRRGCAILGYNQDEILGRNWFDSFVPPSVAGDSRAMVKRFLEGEGAYGRYEGWVQTRSGERRNILWHGVVLRDDDGTALGVLASGEDVTEHRRAESLNTAQRDLAVKLSATDRLDEGLHLCLETALEVSEMDSGGIYLLNTADGSLDLAVHTGLSPAFVDAVRHYSPDSPSARLVASGKPAYTSYPEVGGIVDDVRREEGLHAIGIIPVTHLGQVIGCLNIASHQLEDVPDHARVAIETVAAQIGSAVTRLQAEEALRDSEQAFHAITEAIPVPVGISARPGGTILWENTHLSPLFGLPPGSMAGRTTTDFFTSLSDREFVRTALDRCGRLDMYEFEARRADGTPVWVMASVQPMVFQGEEASITGFYDITKRKHLEDELRDLYDQERELSQRLEEEINRRIEFTRVLAHELKTPLTPVMSSSQLLEAMLEDEAASKLAQNISRGASNLNRRIDELLDLARGEIGTLRLKEEIIDLRQLIREVIHDMIPLAAERDQTLTTRISRKLPIVRGDSDRIRQILLNLLNNSIKFNQPGGQISILASSDDSGVTIEVRDTGTGIPKEDLPRLFEPYSRLEGDREHLSGLGLGLALCKTLVELHGGEVWARSRPGRGTTIGFSLPVGTREGVERKKRSKSGGSREGSNSRG